MKIDIWRYIPAVKKPWNPAWQDVWATMSHRDRQISFLIDCGIIVMALAAGVLGYRYGLFIQHAR